MTGVARLGVGIGLVGRRHEVSALTAALDRAAAGRPTGVVLSGDAGVGKSRLVAEAVRRATASGFTALVGRCLDTDWSALPYLPFAEIVGRLAAEQPDLVAGHPALLHLLPGGRPRREQRPEERDLGQLRVFDAVLSALDELTAAAPVLLVVEDLHWADRSSRDLLVFLLSRLSSQRLMVLATYRSDDVHRRHPLRPVLSELVRLPTTERIDLAPLGGVEALELVRRLADGSLPAPLLHSVARRSEGNAFFAEELVSAASDGVPHELTEVLLARIERLSPVTHLVLRVAAVAGRHVHHDQLAVVAGIGVDELEQALREAVENHVLVAEPRPDRDAYVFRHALLREAVHQELLPGERSRLHGAFAALLSAPTGPDEPGWAAALAHHALAAHDLPRALAASVAAAREADEQEAPAELLVHAERALELWSAVPDAEAVAGASEILLTRWASWAASATGDPDRGEALARRALALAREQGDPVLTAVIDLRYAMRLVERDGRRREAGAAAARALELLAGLPPSEETAWCHAVLARARYHADEFDRAVHHAEKAVRLVAELPADDNARAAAADALVTLAGCDEYSGRPDSGRRRLAQAGAIARRVGDVGTELRVRFAAGISFLEEMRLAEATAEFAAGQERAAATGLRWSTPGLDVRVAHVVTLFLQGEWDAAESSADLAGAWVPAGVSARLVAAGMQVATARGRFDVVERRYAELCDALSQGWQTVVLMGPAATESALWRGEPAAALERSSEALAALDALEPFRLGGLALLALALAAHADLAASRPPDAADLAAARPDAARLDAARLVAEKAEETAVKGMPRGVTLGPEGRAWQLRARAELTRLTDPDPAAWTAVHDAFGYETSDAPGYRQSYALLRRAEARLALGAGHGEVHGTVEADLRVALTTAQRLGAVPLAGAVRALAGRAGVRLDAATRPAVPDLLTPRERSVLALVAAGRTNRQAGAELFISEKTVSVHLSRVMAKLGAAGRTEAVSIAHARGLLGPPSP